MSDVQMSSSEFTPVSGTEWLVDRQTAASYIAGIYHRRKHIDKFGSILPLPISRVELGDPADNQLQDLGPTFTEITETLASEVSPHRLAYFQKVRQRTAERRRPQGWHVDRSARTPNIYSFRFILSASREPDLGTLYASIGSPIIHSNALRPPLQPTPSPEDVLQASGDIIYFMPIRQSTHATPEGCQSPDSVLFNRFAHFAVAQELQT